MINEFKYNEKVKTPYGTFSSLDVDEIGIAQDYDGSYSDLDIFAIIDDTVYFFIMAIPTDYNMAHVDEWDYARESHSTSKILYEDLTTDQWVRESIDNLDVIDLLLTHKKIHTQKLEQ